MPDHIEQNLEHVAETFRDSMNTSAKADGKYVVFIISNNQMVVCHSYTGKHALTTGMDIVEELLSEGNIDKYANFTLNESGEISVQHFDKYDTKSFADWLGLPDDDIVFDIKGSVRINLEIDGLEGVLEVDEEEVTNKLVKNDSYDISDNVLKLPNESNKSISSIRWGNDYYEDTNTFKSEIMMVNYELHRIFNKFEQNFEQGFDLEFGATEDSNTVTVEVPNDQKKYSKSVNKMDVLFTTPKVDMKASWKNDIANGFFNESGPRPMCHAGAEFIENPIPIGNIRMYSDIDIPDESLEFIRHIEETAEDIGSGNLRQLFAYIEFEFLSRAVENPTQYFFDEMSSEFRDRLIRSLSINSGVLQTEGESVDMEFKSAQWYVCDIDEIAKKMHKQFQNSRLLVIGISEEEKEFEPVPKHKAKSEHMQKIENKIESGYDMENVHVWSFRADGGFGILGLNVTDSVNDFTGDLSVLERTPA